MFNNFWEVVKVKVCKDGGAGLKALSAINLFRC